MSPRRLAKLTAAARSWYLAEIAYIAERNPAAARKISAMLRAARETIAGYPNIGRPSLTPGMRRVVVGPYVLTTRREKRETIIIDIRHGRQADGKE